MTTPNRIDETTHPLRRIILESFTVSPNGRIMDAGKFEGELLYMPHLYRVWMEESCDTFYNDNDEVVSLIPTSPEERKAFPELGDRGIVWFTENDDGFIIELTVPPEVLEMHK